MPSSLYVVATALLGQDPGEWIRARRETGQDWRGIAADLSAVLRERGGGEIQVSHETARAWSHVGGEVAS